MSICLIRCKKRANDQIDEKNAKVHIPILPIRQLQLFHN